MGKLSEAEAACATLLKEYPDYVAALYNLGVICEKKGSREMALYYLCRAAMFCPNHILTLKALGGLYVHYESYELAANSYEQALKQDPRSAELLVKLGQVAWLERQYEKSLAYYRRAAEIDPSNAESRIGLGRCLNYLDQHEEAAKILDDVVNEGAATLTTMQALRTFPPQFLRADLLSRLPDAVSAVSEDSGLLALLRGSLLDRAGRHAEAWESLVAGNRIFFAAKRRSYLVGVQGAQKLLEGMRRADPVPWRNESGQQDAPISLFIAGSSRSGKTVAERLIATVRGVTRGYESPIVGNCVRRLLQENGFPTSNSLTSLPTDLDASFGELYLANLRDSARAARVFTNTSPNLVGEALRLAQVIPSTRFVFIKRDIDDTVFRIFEKHYAGGNSYAYDLRAIYENVTRYHLMIDLMLERLPGRSILLRYEDMVADSAAALRSMTELCGLAPFTGELPTIGDDRGCAKPYKEYMARELQG